MKPLWSVAPILLLAASTGAQAPAETTADVAREAVTLLRALNTVEAEHNAKAGGYAPLEQVLGSATFKKMITVTPSATDSVTAAAGRTTLVLVVSEDKKHYQALVTTKDHCGATMFTNERGLIYTGRALGCENRS